MKRSIEDTPVVFIGAGNLATNLAKALYYKGFRIVQVYSRTEESARALAEKVEADYTTDLQEISKDAKLYIVSLKDAAFVELLPQITEGKQKSLLVHTAGSIPMSVWEGHAERYGVFYPMQTFSKQREVDFQEVPFFIEAKRAEDTELLKAIASLRKCTKLIQNNAKAFIWQPSLSVISQITCMRWLPICSKNIIYLSK